MTHEQVVIRRDNRSRILRGLSILSSIVICVVVACAASPTNIGPTEEELGNEDQRFLQWATLASAGTTSPAHAEPGDYARDWTAPDGRTIKLVVKVPHPRGTASVTLEKIPDGEDARPYFEKALARVRTQGLGRLIIPPGTYVFRTLAANAEGHLLLENLSDVSIEGAGATLLFTHNQPGISINHSQRLRITGVTLDYTLRTSSLGKVVERRGHNVLMIDPKYPVTAADAIYFVSEYDADKHAWVPGGLRAIMQPGSSDPAVYAGDQTYASAAFKPLKVDRDYVVYHQWYGGSAIKILDTPGPNQSEDIVIDGITLHSAPGMGILTYGLKRGLAIVNSRITPRPDGSSPVSTNFDAIHVLLGGGDILIQDNHVAGQGDDGINLNNPVHPIESIADNGRTLVLSKYSRFISLDDTLAFFGEDGRFLDQARVTDKPKPLGGLNTQITIDHSILDLMPRSVVRDLALLSSRFDVSGNTIEACNCHGILVQIPNGRVAGNTFRNLRANAIRLLTDVGSWKEGIGAFNVIVSHNTIVNSGIDSALPLPWAAISAYGGARGNVVAKGPVNRYLKITDNVISNAKQGCLTIASSRDVEVADNTCNSTNSQDTTSDSVSVLASSRVTLTRNKRTGESGGIKIDAASTRDIKPDRTY